MTKGINRGTIFSQTAVSIELPQSLPNVCLSQHCLRASIPGSDYCQSCGLGLGKSNLDLSGDIILFAIQAASGPINLGTTTSIKRRLADLQSGNHELLVVLAHCAVRPNTVKDLMLLLDTTKIRGKWFPEANDVLQVVLHIKRGSEAIVEYVADNAYRLQI